MFGDVFVCHDDDGGYNDKTHQDCEEDFDKVEVLSIIGLGKQGVGQVEETQSQDDGKRNES